MQNSGNRYNNKYAGFFTFGLGFCNTFHYRKQAISVFTNSGPLFINIEDQSLKYGISVAYGFQYYIYQMKRNPNIHFGIYFEGQTYQWTLYDYSYLWKEWFSKTKDHVSKESNISLGFLFGIFKPDR